MKILWLDINCSYVHSSLALPAIHAQSAGLEGIEWESVSATISTPLGRVLEEVVRHQPQVIAATAWMFTVRYLTDALSRLRVLLPEAVVILGGPEFLGPNERFLRTHPEVDAVFRGEGESEFLRWLEIKGERSRWSDLPGLCFIDESGRYHDGGVARVKDFAGLHPPERSRFFDRSKPFVQLETARGCFNGCSFCVSGNDKPVRTVPLPEIRSRIADIRRHGTREIRMLDRTFNANPGRAQEMLRIFREFPDMRFHLEIHPAFLTRDLREELESFPPHTLHLEAGIQSLDDKVLRACGRAGRVSDALDGLRFLCGLDHLVTHVDLIVGLPFYSLDRLFEDVGTLARFGAGEIQVELLKVLPGTKMAEDSRNLGIRYAPSPPYEVLRTDEMTAADIRTGHLLSRLLDFYYNARAWGALTRRLIVEAEGFLPRFLGWMRSGERLEQPLSVEKRGLLLLDFLAAEFPASLSPAAKAWRTAGLTERKIKMFL